MITWSSHRVAVLLFAAAITAAYPALAHADVLNSFAGFKLINVTDHFTTIAKEIPRTFHHHRFYPTHLDHQYHPHILQLQTELTPPDPYRFAYGYWKFCKSAWLVRPPTLWTYSCLAGQHN